VTRTFYHWVYKYNLYPGQRLKKEDARMIELDGEKYLDGNEASNLLGVKMSTLYTYVSRGILRSYKQGIKRQRLYKQAELESLLRLRPSDTPSPISTTKQSTEDTSEPTKGRAEIPLAEDWVPYM
jgi:excisionase family DNA binding protein